MGGKLYRVTVEVELFCYSEHGETDACDVARWNLRDADGELRKAIVTASEVKSLSMYKQHANALPWGGPGQLTCAEILEGK